MRHGPGRHDHGACGIRLEPDFRTRGGIRLELDFRTLCDAPLQPDFTLDCAVMRERCDVLVVGGGPAGSTCARDLVRAGLDVIVMDRAVFPRDKPCAGWITPDVVAALHLDLAEYARGRTLQPITGFDIGVLGGRRTISRYEDVVSYAIRRCEFDTWLLERCGARVRQGVTAGPIERLPDGWRVGDVEARMLVGAGGHFCPVARLLNPRRNVSSVVAAQELEVPLEAADVCPVAPDVPELYFCRDLRGYGWCVRKEGYLNVGFGRLDQRGLPEAARAFFDTVRRQGRVPAAFPSRWVGHAYRIYGEADGRVSDAGVLLAGDAAGLAFPASGEGILPAVVSGQLAARAIVAASPAYTRDRLDGYDASLEQRFGMPGAWSHLSAQVPPALTVWIGRHAMAVPWFVRHVVVPRFLHAA